MRMPACVLCLTALISAPTAGQSLKLPTSPFIATASGDWVTTFTFLSKHTAREGDPLLRFAHSRPVETVAAGAAMDAAGLYAWTRFAGRHHPKIAAAGLYAATAFRSYLILRGLPAARIVVCTPARAARNACPDAVH